MKTKREIIRSSQFRKDLRKSYKQGKDIALLDEIISITVIKPTFSANDTT